MKRATEFFLFAVLTVLLMSFSTVIYASDSDSCYDAPPVVQEAIKSNVLILVFMYDDLAKDFTISSQGTGVVIAPNYILSAPHVFTSKPRSDIDKSKIKIFIRRNIQDSVTWEASVVDYKLSYELVLLRVNPSGEKIQIQGLDCKNSDLSLIGHYLKEKNTLSLKEKIFSIKPVCVASHVKEGEKVWANGFSSFGFLNNCFLAPALLVAKNNFITWTVGIDPIQFFQGHLEPGFSGGAIFNIRGEIAGDVFGFPSGSSAIFMASPPSSITDFLNNIKDPDFVKAFNK